MRLFSLLTAGMLILGCGDPNEPSNANFKRALQTSWAEGFFDAQFDCHTDEPFSETQQQGGFRSEDYRFCEKLRERGLLTRHDTLFEQYGQQTRGVYFARTDKEAQTWSQGRKLIVGTPKIVEVINYSEPQSVFGYTVAEVTYTYRVDDIPGWLTPGVLAGTTACVRDAAERNNDYDCRKDFLNSREQPIQRTVRMVLTGEGWMTEDAYTRLTDA